MQFKTILYTLLLILVLPTSPVAMDVIFNSGLTAIQDNKLDSGQEAIDTLNKLLSGAKAGQKARINNFIKRLQEEMDKKRGRAPAPIEKPKQQPIEQPKPVEKPMTKQPIDQSQQMQDTIISLQKSLTKNAALQRDLTQAQAKANDLQDRLNSAQNRIVELNTAIEGTINTMDATITNLKTTVSERLTDLNRKIEALTQQRTIKK